MGEINRKRKRQANNQKNNPNEESIIQPAPYVIVVHGPPKVGKTLLIKSLLKHYSNQNQNLTDDTDAPGHIAIVAGSAGEEQRRIQFVECPNNVNGMIDAAKYADAVILLIDVSYEFEMETFEFVSLLKVHGMPKVIGVFTHLDCFPTEDANTKEIITARFKNNFRNEIYEQAQIVCLSAPDEDEMMYQKLDISELASIISGMELHPMPWRAAHPYVLVDRFEDVTPTERLHVDSDCDRDIILYGYLRGCDIDEKGIKVHIAGIGDFPLAAVTSVAIPRPSHLVDVTDLKIDITEHSNLDEETHSKEKILRIGSYLKFKVCNVPSGMVDDHSPCQPILVGGISHREDTTGYVSARLERHSFRTKSLRTNDPIIVSAGWRRYQTSFIYSPEDLSLDFTPEDKTCSAMFGGYFATTGTGVVALQRLADNKAAFRILATGEVLGFVSCPALSMPCDIPQYFGTLMTSLEPSDRVWAADTKESEKSKAHVVWGSLERKVAAEGLRDKMSKLQEEMLKLPCQKRKTEEQRRAVIILERLSFGNRAEFLEAYQKKEEDIRENRSHGMVSRYYRRETGNTTVAN
ncbi:hypothetical protein MKW92_027654 [Papaver armeniacum]|nr:hypothetical protein MKW92_027654 [Papaver armeniacum]